MFDSFCLPPNIYSFDPSFIHFSSHSIHSFGSKVYGHYALVFINLKSRKYLFVNTINNLTNTSLTHPLLVRYMIYFVLDYLTYIVPVNVAKMNHNTAIF